MDTPQFRHPPAADAAKAGFCRDHEERALAKLDTTPPPGFPEVPWRSENYRLITCKAMKVQDLKVFAFYAPFPNVRASHMQISFLGAFRRGT
jgi:hypothetical protein